MPEFTGTITQPGLYGDIPEDAYHADPVPGGSLSVSGAKKLLPPSCPAIFDYQRGNPKPPTKSMELGTVVHGLVLGTGQPVEIIEAGNWRKKDDQAARDAAIASGRVPMLRREYDEAAAIARAVKDDPDAGPLFDEGDAEQSMFWRDPEFGIWCRGRLDWLTWFDGRPVIADLKTGADASPEEFARSVANFSYHMQHPYYCDGLSVLLGCDPGDIEFLFTVVPTAPPYLVMTYRLNDRAIELGREQNRIARETYRDCSESGYWPKWSRDITDLALPRYAASRIESEINDWYDHHGD